MLTGSKWLLPTDNIERFINFISPNASQRQASKIDFNSLSNIGVKSTGLFGSKQEICQMLLKLGFADPDLYVLPSFVDLLQRSNTTKTAMKTINQNNGIIEQMLCCNGRKC